MPWITIPVLAYLIGSIPNGLIIGKWIYGIDIRQSGSKNIGATNAYRVLGAWPAFWVFLTDALKGVAGVLIGQAIGGDPIDLIVGGLAAIIGHNWPVFLGFKGGRGVATGLGVIAVLSPMVTVVVFLIWAAIVYITRYVSVASVVAAMTVPIFMRLFGDNYETLIFGILAAFFVIIRHKANLERLFRGEEPKIKAPGSVSGKKTGKEGKP
mgnify:CR=1 FL=1